jgi:hypothetical protein
MNIFVTSPCPIESAKFLDDKRVIKMILESAQMLSTAINERGGSAPYRSTHKNHPANVWARTTRSNWIWLFNHFEALSDEYYRRFNKVHKSSLLKTKLWELKDYIPEGRLTPFVNCAANESKGVNYKNHVDTFEAYKLYLKDRWATDTRLPKWS